jgi:hypothetical protein
MALGLLAKDSIQDFTLLAGEASEEDDPILANSEDESNSVQSSVHSRTSSTNEITSEPLASQFSEPVPSAEGSEEPVKKQSNSEEEEEALQTAANPQQAQEEGVDEKAARFPPSTTSYSAQYAGFRTDYYQTQYNNDHDSYAPVIVLDTQNQQPLFPKLLYCLFPWMNTTPHLSENRSESFQPDSYEQDTGLASAKTTGVAAEEDENSNGSSKGSDVFGEKLSDKERQAVLARLGMAQPDSDTSENSSTERKGEKKGLLNGIATYDTSPVANNEGKLKGILKRSFTDFSASNQQTKNNQSQDLESQKGPRRRSLFPSSYVANLKTANQLNHVMFAPMARVVTVKSKNDMTKQDKADIWWQRPDYEDFRKTGRIITKAMLTGGSEIWLHSTSAKKSSESGDMSPTTTGDKWWHKFGHTRRGLEHVVSTEEGRDRQINVRNAIHAILEEQTRQKAYKREDPDKLRIVALNHTSWARDLSLAAGASDADAVKTSFAEDRKSREFFLLKMARVKANPSRTLPSFMKPVTHTKKDSMASPRRLHEQVRLDANTAAQICFRRRTTNANGSTAPPSRKESSEPIRDRDPEEGESLAHRAAGFLVNGERVDMAAALAGMGAVAQESAAS